ncbi:thioesterase family protein [Citromicrobium bathyomarinum]|uniref:acyl-CoA thioesterase n=1 Tax=Sphingomonadales TaxID=204457 RepID=UPI00267ED391|tara:strand:+ start:67713 stop:68495 length:783 start_codon:yes stop_codon:yes gene_type:complete
MSITAMLEPIAGNGEPVTLPAQEWLQGRTLYGGASALIAYTAAIRAFPDLPPLRSAQVAFVAPVGADVTPRAEIIRQGRNVTQVRVDLLVDGKPGLTSFWLFGAAREPNGVHRAPPVSPAPIPFEDAEPMMEGKGPAFIQHQFEIRRAEPSGGHQEAVPVMRRWVRLKNDDGLDPVSRSVLLGDVNAPSAIRVMERPGPLSSMNWAINILDPEAETRDGWWLAGAASDHADAGYSSERLRLWNADGQLVMVGQQAVAVFG